MSAVVEELKNSLGDAYEIERELPPAETIYEDTTYAFVAVDRSSGQRVLVKILPPKPWYGVSAQKFERELNFARLPHPNILPVVGSGVVAGLLYYITPFIGESLRERLEHGPLPLDLGLRFLAEVADAIAFAHARGIMHRHLDPDSIRLHDDHALVADFGLADAVTRATDTYPTPPPDEGVLGASRYMTPESNLYRRCEFIPALDVRAFAMVAYETLVGNHPSQYPAGTVVVSYHLPPPVHIARYVPLIPRGTAGWIMRGVSPNRLDHEGLDLASFKATLKSGPMLSRRQKLAAAAVVVAVLIGVIAIARAMVD